MSENAPVWLVTGSSGFLGSNVGMFLANRAHRVGVVRSATAPDEFFDEYVVGDLENPTDLISLIDTIRPDVILHAAAMASHEACEADPARARLVNSWASGELARAATRLGSQFVLVSTDAVFAGTRGKFSEQDVPNPSSVYGATKLEAERNVLRSTDALVVRTNFFGWSPSGRRSILEFFVDSLSRGIRVSGFTDFTTSSAYTQMLAEAIWEMVSLEVTGLVHVTSPDTMTKFDFGRAVAQEFGLDPALITPAQSDTQPPRRGDISLDVSRAEALLGRRLPTMIEGIRWAHDDESMSHARARLASLGRSQRVGSDRE